jgi:hypothetical protein
MNRPGAIKCARSGRHFPPQRANRDARRARAAHGFIAGNFAHSTPSCGLP